MLNNGSFFYTINYKNKTFNSQVVCKQKCNTFNISIKNIKIDVKMKI